MLFSQCLSPYQAELKYRRITYLELKQYADTSSLIDGIVYYSRFTDHVYATKEYLTLSDGVPYKKENPIL